MLSSSLVESSDLSNASTSTTIGGTLRIGLQSIKLRRLDGVEEDDFKTWAQCSVVRSDTLVGVDFWYNQDDNLSKTSVRAII